MNPNPDPAPILRFFRAGILAPWSNPFITWPFVAAILLVSVYMHTAILIPNHDVSWFLVAADRVIAGGRYAEDFYEVNPPLAILLYAPGALLAGVVNSDLYSAFLITCYIVVLASILASNRILRHVFPERPELVGFLTVVSTGLLLLLPHYDFGQREHLVAVLITPFLFASAAEDVGRPMPSRFFFIVVCAAAAIGVFVKFFLVLLPCVIFLLRLARERSLRVLVGADVLTFLFLGLGYIALVLVFFPGWIEVTRSTVAFYGAYNKGWSAVLPKGLGLVALAVVLLGANRFLGLASAAEVMSRNFGLAAMNAALGYVVQQKGWSYHFLPALTALIMAMTVSFAALLAGTQPGGSTRGRPRGWLAVGLMASVVLAFAARDVWRADTLRSSYTRGITQALRGRMPGEPLFVFSSSLPPAFPLVAIEQRPWASRFPCLWLLPGIVRRSADAAGGGSANDLAAARRFVTGSVVADFRRFRPGVVLVHVGKWKQGFVGPFDYLEFFRNDPAFEAIWRGYQFVERVGEFELYFRSD